MADRWFSDEELRDMARPTMDRAIEAIDRGDLDEARALCDAMKHEWRHLHDLMVEGIAGLISFVQERYGEDAVADAWTAGQGRGWKRDVEKIASRERRDIVHALAATWRAHSCSGTGPHPGAFTIEEDEEKFTFRMNPCGSGQRLVRMGRYEGPNALGVTQEAHDWSYGRKGFPLYCTHCSFMNESLPIRWIGYPLYPSDPPDDFNRDPCTWYWYKDPKDIPERHAARYSGAGIAQERELVAAFSLAREAPEALAELKATGSCSVVTPESTFDDEMPGHFVRRIRDVAVSLPGVTGPFTGVPVTLTQPGSRPESGLFLSSDTLEEVFQPFEGAGAVSEWRIELPRAAEGFQLGDITDVVLRLRYTARHSASART